MSTLQPQSILNILETAKTLAASFSEVAESERNNLIISLILLENTVDKVRSFIVWGNDQENLSKVNLELDNLSAIIKELISNVDIDNFKTSLNSYSENLKLEFVN